MTCTSPLAAKLTHASWQAEPQKANATENVHICTHLEPSASSQGVSKRKFIKRVGREGCRCSRKRCSSSRELCMSSEGHSQRVAKLRRIRLSFLVIRTPLLSVPVSCTCRRPAVQNPGRPVQCRTQRSRSSSSILEARSMVRFRQGTLN